MRFNNTTFSIYSSFPRGEVKLTAAVWWNRVLTCVIQIVCVCGVRKSASAFGDFGIGTNCTNEPPYSPTYTLHDLEIHSV